MADTATERRTGIVRRVLRQIGPVRLLVMLALLAGGLYVARYSWSLPLLGDGERALYDLRFVRSAERVGQDKDITLVTYTDDTLIQLEKRSPLDRRMLAQALRVIDTMNPRAIGIDILFDQPQAEDEELIATLRAMRTPTYIAYVRDDDANDRVIQHNQQEFLDAFIERARTDRVKPASVQMDADVEDGVVRRWGAQPPNQPPILSRSMSPEAAALLEGYIGPITYRIPASDDTPVFAEIPIDVLAGFAELPPEALAEVAAALRSQFEGRYILIGGNIFDFDQKETPMTPQTGRQMIGLEVHAHMLRQLLDGHAPGGLSPFMLWVAAALIVVAGAVTGMLELRGLFLVLGLLVQLALIAFLPFLLEAQDVGTLKLPAAGWGAGWLLAFIGIGIAARAVGAEQRKFAHSALGKYLPVDVANEIMRDPERLTLTGEKTEIFALFTDLEGFTKLSHAITPERLSGLLNTYLDTMSDIILDHGGTIDKFVGDAVVAFWGAPIARDDDGARAAKAAVALFEAGEAFRRDAGDDVPPIGCTRVGLHKGEAVVGNFGGEKRIQYTALGDGMNTAARLESANKALKTTVLVSRSARDASGLDIFRPMGRIVLSGRATPIEVWEPKPGMDSGLRTQLAGLWERYDGGDKAALAEIEAVAAAHKEDEALANFVFRIREAGPGGQYVLGSK